MGVAETFRAVCRDVFIRLNETLNQQYGSYRSG